MEIVEFGTCGVCCLSGGAHVVQCHGVHQWGGCIRGSFHIGQIVGHGEGAEVRCNEEDIDGVNSEGVGDKHVGNGGDVGRNKEGDTVNSGSEDRENENVVGSSTK